MTIVKDILDTYKEFKKDSDDFLNLGKSSRQSISKSAKKGTLQFPVIVSKTLSLEEVTTISKALERQYVSFVRIMTSLNSSTSSAKDIEGYLKSIHQNFDLDDVDSMYRVGTFVRSAEKALGESLQSIHDINMSLLKETKDFNELDYVKTTDVDPKMLTKIGKLVEEKTGGKVYRDNNGNLFSLNEDKVKEIFIHSNDDSTLTLSESPEFEKGYKGMLKMNMSLLESSMKLENKEISKPYESIFNEAILNDMSHNSNMVLISEKKGQGKKATANKIPTSSPTPPKPASAARIISNSKVNLDGNLNVKGITQKIPVTNKFTINNTIEPSQDSVKHISREVKLTDNDVKKANELVPSMLQVTTHFTDSEGRITRSEDYIIGIKTIVHPVSSDSIIENLVKGVKRDKTFFNFLRLTTGEIAFFKDFLLAITDIKDEVKTKYRDNQWWSALQRRKHTANLMKRIQVKNAPLPNSTIVISMEEVERIKQSNNIDFLNPKYGKDLIKSYYLLGFVILDSSLEVAHFMFDGDVDFSQLSFTALERENSNQAREMKNMMQLLGKL